MREIKFKFILEDKKTGKKIISDPYTMKDIRNGFDDDRVYDDLEQKYGCDGNCTTESVAHCECGEVFPNSEIIESVQCTGLKDITGSEIYEGDIVTDGHTTGAVVFVNGSFRIDGWHGKNFRKGVSLLYWEDSGVEDIRIIGNIHQNPELLAA